MGGASGMRLNRPEHRRRYISLTPLVDVVFLLLVFFMMASTFLKFGTIEIEAAGSGPEARLDVAAMVLVHVDADGAFRVDGATVSEAGLDAALGERLARGKREAVVVVKRGATVRDLVRGLAVVRRHRFASVRVVD